MLLMVVMILAMIPFPSVAATKWNLEGWRTSNPTNWISGLVAEYTEGSYVPMRLEATSFNGIDGTIIVEYDYMDATGHIGFDGSKDWFIGPVVNKDTPIDSVQELFTPGTSTFTVSSPVVSNSSNGKVVQYTITIALELIPTLLEMKEWTLYWEAHLSKTGTANSVEPGNVQFGSSYWNGASLHVRTKGVTGNQDIPVKTPVRTGINPSISIEKLTNGYDPNMPSELLIKSGDPVKWTYTVTNTSEVYLTDIIVTDDKGVEPVYISGDLDGDDALSPDEVWIYEASDIAQIGEYTNIATVTAKYGETAINASDISHYFGADAKMTIDKTTDKQVYSTAGEEIDYEIKVTNTGNVTLTNVNVSDNLISNLDGPETPGTLAIGQTWTFTGTYTVTQADVDRVEIKNTATAESDETDPITDSVSVKSSHGPVLAVEKTADPMTYDKVGDIITYTIKVKNLGNVTLTNISVEDTLLEDLDYASGNTNNDQNLDINEVWVYTGTYTITQADLERGYVDNTVTADSLQTDGVEDDVRINAVQSKILEIVKSADRETFNKPGDVIVYTIEVSNGGNVTLTGIEVNDPLLEDLKYDSGDTNQDGMLDVGETWKYSGSYTITQSNVDSGIVENTATADSVETDEVEDSVVVISLQDFALEIVKFANRETFNKPGDVIVYTIEVSNGGNVTLTGIEVSDPMLKDLKYVSGDTNEDNKLDINETWMYTGSYMVTQIDVDFGRVDNTATANSAETDPVNDSVTVTSSQGPALSINKSAVESRYTAIGDVIHYTITVKNTGNVTLTGVTVNDSLIPNLTGPIGYEGQTGTLEVGDTWTFTGTYTTTQADMNARSVTNTATADSNQTTPVNDSVTINRYIPTTTTTTTRTPDPDPGRIEIFKFLDVDNSASFNTGDLPFSNILFQLYNEDDDLVGTATTNSQGNAVFSNLDEGTYFIKEVRGDYTITTPTLNADGMIEVEVVEDETTEVSIGNYREVIPPQEPPLGPPPIIEEVIEDKVPQGPPALPKTGELPPYFAYGFGSLLVLAGLFMKRKF
jgi:uncharacterized repeat protein (TIGR01451 family)